jgi:hypothetical protein
MAFVDQIRKLITNYQLQYKLVTGFIMNEADWRTAVWEINSRYVDIFDAERKLWGVPVTVRDYTDTGHYQGLTFLLKGPIP